MLVEIVMEVCARANVLGFTEKNIFLRALLTDGFHNIIIAAAARIRVFHVALCRNDVSPGRRWSRDDNTSNMRNHRIVHIISCYTAFVIPCNKAAKNAVFV